jgi:hypothetical protein
MSQTSRTPKLRTTPRINLPCRLALCTTLLALTSLTISGCYERVIHADGPGAFRSPVQQPYQESNQVDDWLFGPLEKPGATSPIRRGSR